MKHLPNRVSTVLFLVFALTGLTAVKARPGPRHALTPNAMRFVYREFEGTRDVVCKHSLKSTDNPYDWKVECFDGTAKFAEYTAHVALTEYPMTGATQLSIELLYWLMGTNLPSEVGSTTWFHFATKAELQGISMSQTVEHGTAGLYLEIGQAAIRLSNWAR